MATTTGMGRARTLWEKLCFAESNPFARFEDGLQVPLDFVLPAQSARALLKPFEGDGVIPADPSAATQWGFAADQFLESGRAAQGARVAAGDPHVIGLGALGIHAAFRTPAVLWVRWEDGYDRVGLPRQTLVQVNGPLAPGAGPTDVALHLAREGGGPGFAGAVLEFRGEGVTAQSIAHRRILCAASALTGCLTALVPADAAATQHLQAHASDRRSLGTEAGEADPGAAYDELVVVNGDELEPLASTPDHGVRAARELSGKPVRRVVIGGCVGGDLDSLQEAATKIRGERIHAEVELLLVPATESIFRRFADTPARRELETSGARLARPQDVPLGADTPTITTTTCLAPRATLAGLDVCLASALRGRFSVPMEVLA